MTLLKRWVGLLILALLIAVGVELNRPYVLGAAYTGVSAYHLTQAVVGKKHRSEHLQHSWVFALRALQQRPRSVTAARLALRALLEDSHLPGAESLRFPELLVNSNDLLALYAGQVMWESGDHQRAIELWRSGKRLDSYFMHLGDQAYGQSDVQSALNY